MGVVPCPAARRLSQIAGLIALADARGKTEPLGDHVPDFVIAPAQFAPWMFPPGSRQPIWWNDETAVYALDGAVDPITPPLWAEPLPFSVQLSDVHETDGRIAFNVTFNDRAAGRWASQDWVPRRHRSAAVESPETGPPRRWHRSRRNVVCQLFESW